MIQCLRLVEEADMVRPVAPYSPDFTPPLNPIEILKAALRKAAARTRADLWDAIALAIETFPPTECENDFATAGYDRE
jgi:transposase